MFYIRSKDNVKIATYVLNPHFKKTIVLIHGWPLSEKIFEYQKELLSYYEYRVVTIDIRGFGNSDTPADGYTYNQIADDIYTVIRSLNLNSFILVGFSMGGAIASRYMGRYNGYGVKKLVLLAAAAPCFTKRDDFPYGVSKKSVDELIEQARIDRPQFCFDFSQKLLYCCHTDALKDWFRYIALSASGIGTIKTAFSLRDEDCRKDLKKIHVPTGIFHGKKDIIVPFELAIQQNKEIPNSKLFSFENSGHGIFYDELEKFNNCFLSFIEDK